MVDMLPRPAYAQETDWLMLTRAGPKDMRRYGPSPCQVIADWQVEHPLCRILWTCIRVDASFNYSGVKRRDICIKIYYRIR